MRSKVFNFLFPISVVINLGLWVVAWRLFSPEESAATLHYSAVVGVDFIGESHHVYLLPLAGLLVLLGNAVLGWLIRRTSTRASVIVWIAMLVVQVILALSFVTLWRLNSN